MQFIPILAKKCTTYKDQNNSNTTHNPLYRYMFGRVFELFQHARTLALLLVETEVHPFNIVKKHYEQTLLFQYLLSNMNNKKEHETSVIATPKKPNSSLIEHERSRMTYRYNLRSRKV